MPESDNINLFLKETTDLFQARTLGKITLGKPSKKNNPYSTIFIRPVTIKNQLVLSFIYRYENKDVTTNYEIDEALDVMKRLLETDFLQANLLSQKHDLQWTKNKKGNTKLIFSKPTQTLLKPFTHDKIKKRPIEPEGKFYLQRLGVTTSEGKVIPAMFDKFRQINKFIEIVDSILTDSRHRPDIHVADMGCGKGYLTFALYDYLKNTLGFSPTITGVEIRGELVEKCNKIATEAGFARLEFKQGTIESFEIENIDMLIALHACDTATDDAISKGIKANAAFIIVAPCCQKQIRKEMTLNNLLEPVLKHGIFMERQAEMLTDGLRALFLELYGYQTKVVEFISTEHTPKNVMIIGIKHSRKVDKQNILDKIHAIKSFFGIEKHYLETLLNT